MLILDEPTSGVDPIPRDTFWQYLISLSRDDGAPIFLSTHFVNEGERRDRISLMHAAKFLAVGPAKELSERAASLDIVWPQLGALAAITTVYFGISLMRFRTTIASFQ